MRNDPISHKLWRKKNAEHLRKYWCNYRLKNPQRGIEFARQYRKKNKDTIRARRQRIYSKNKTTILQRGIEWRKNNMHLCIASKARMRRAISNGYLRDVLRIKGDIPTNFLELKREHLILQRKLKEINI